MSAPRHATFISYRRRDSAYAVDRLDERLKQAFGANAVFRDVRSIRKGRPFPDDIRAALNEARIGIVVIGPLWLEVDVTGGPDSVATGILYLLGLFDRPVRSDLLDELRSAPVIAGLTDALVPIPDVDWLATLSQLEELLLISREPLPLVVETAEERSIATRAADEVPDELVERLLQHDEVPEAVKELSKAELKQLLTRAAKIGKRKGAMAERSHRPASYTVSTHPLLREHFGADLRDRHPQTWHAAHRRLYHYLYTTTPDKDDPSLEDLQPLYQAVAHGCRAQLFQAACDDVYFQRIKRGNESYSYTKLGAFSADLGAIAGFFEVPWSRVSSDLKESDQAWLLNEAAVCLRALGRLREALEPTKMAAQLDIQRNAWDGAARCYHNLSELSLLVGDLSNAVRNAEQSVAYAGRISDDWRMFIVSRAVLASALHYAGRRKKALALFQQAEDKQTQSQITYPILYSVQGCEYCDLLLGLPERAAWQCSLIPIVKNQIAEPLKRSREVQRRMERTMSWAKMAGQGSLLDIAVSHLTLGRAAFYCAILEGSDSRRSNPRSHLDAAVDGLRHSGTQDHLPRALLSRAWQRSLSDDLYGARRDLDEAWQIVERSSMKLFLADIHLHRARLFFREDLGAAREDLKKARALIEQYAYWRRKEELEDAEKAILAEQ